MRSLRKNTVSFVILFFCVTSFKVSAQVKSKNETIWFHFFGKNKLTEKWSFSFEATMRYANGFSEKQQWFLRPSVDYQFTKNFTGSVGYSHYNTYVYGNPAINKIATPENHVWIQGVYVHNAGNFKFTHRLRDENRFVGIAQKNANGEYEIDHYEYRNRLRYMLLVNYPLTKAASGETKLFVLAGDEVFLNIGVNAGKTLLNQNRISGGLGYNFNSHHQFQLAYIHQNIWNFSNTILEDNPTLRVSYITNFNWFKNEK